MEPPRNRPIDAPKDRKVVSSLRLRSSCPSPSDDSRLVPPRATQASPQNRNSRVLRSLTLVGPDKAALEPQKAGEGTARGQNSPVSHFSSGSKRNAEDAHRYCMTSFSVSDQLRHGFDSYMLGAVYSRICVSLGSFPGCLIRFLGSINLRPFCMQACK